MARPRIHVPSTDDGLAAMGGTLCGLFGETEPGSPVTCKSCLWRAEGPSDATGEELLLAAVLGVEMPARFGARELSSTGRRALAAAAEEQGRPMRRWSNVDAAVRYFVRTRDEGASLRSTCDPDRANRVQVSTRPSLGGREHDAIERAATVARALERATRVDAGILAACPHVTPEQALGVYLLTVVGRAVRSHTGLGNRRPQKGWFWRRVTMGIDEVAAYAAEHLEQPIERRHVLALRRHFRAAVQDALVASGEMVPSLSRETGVPPWVRVVRARS